MNKSPIFFVMGVSGCGKSTIGKLLAAEFDLPFFDGDDYHPEFNIKKMASGYPLDDNDRQGWLECLNMLAIKHKNQGVVIACSALKKIYRATLSRSIAKQVDFVYLQGTIDEISERLRQRESHFMPSALLQSQFDTLEVPSNAITVSISNTPLKMVTIIKEKYKNKKL